MGIFGFLKRQPELKQKLKNYTIKDFEFIKNLKDKDLKFLYNDKFIKLIDTIHVVLEVQHLLGQSVIEKRTSEIGYNVLDSNLAYGYYYGFCDFVSSSSKFNGMVELFYLWINIVHRLTKAGNNPKDFVDYFALIQTDFLHDKNCQFYKGCISGGQEAMDWIGEKGSSVMGLVSLLENTKKIEKK